MHYGRVNGIQAEDVGIVKGYLIRLAGACVQPDRAKALQQRDPTSHAAKLCMGAPRLAVSI